MVKLTYSNLKFKNNRLDFIEKNFSLNFGLLPYITNFNLSVNLSAISDNFESQMEEFYDIYSLMYCFGNRKANCELVKYGWLKRKKKVTVTFRFEILKLNEMFNFLKNTMDIYKGSTDFFISILISPLSNLKLYYSIKFKFREVSRYSNVPLMEYYEWSTLFMFEFFIGPVNYKSLLNFLKSYNINVNLSNFI